MLSAYPAIFHKEEGIFWVEFPDLPGCYTTGDDISEVMELAQEALDLYLATQIESEVVPESPTDIRSISLNDETSFVSLVACDVSHYIRSTKAVKKTLTIPDWLNSMAEKNSINFSQTLQKALMEKLHIV